MGIRNYKDLVAWQKAMDLVVEVYRISRTFPKEELYCLKSQLRRAAISVPSNISEGQGRGGSGDFVRYLHIAHGSLREVETQLLIAQRLEYVALAEIQGVLDLGAEVGRLVNGLINSLS